MLLVAPAAITKLMVKQNKGGHQQWYPDPDIGPDPPRPGNARSLFHVSTYLHEDRFHDVRARGIALQDYHDDQRPYGPEQEF